MDQTTEYFIFTFITRINGCDAYCASQLNVHLVWFEGISTGFTRWCLYNATKYHIPNRSICEAFLYLSLSFQERCAAAETISLVARVLNRSRAHLHSVLSQSNTSILEEFFGTMVNSNLEVLHNLIFFL